MRPPDPDDPRVWLEKALSDRRSARALLELTPPAVDTACFHIQQAIEKMLKAVIVARRLRMSFTHDIASLLSILPRDSVLDDLASALSMTTDYAVALRYPTAQTPEMDEVRQSFDAMEKLLAWAQEQMQR